MALYCFHNILVLTFLIVTSFIAFAMRAGGALLKLIVKFTVKLLFGWRVCWRGAVIYVAVGTATVGITVL